MPRVQQKRGTAANLTSVNPTPLAGELLVVSDENTLVVGNGTDAYTSLAYVTATPRSHTHPLSEISDLNIKSPGSPMLPYDVALSYNYVTGTWATKEIGLVGVGGEPAGGWPTGSLGAALADLSTPTAHKSTHAMSGSDPLFWYDIGASSATHAAEHAVGGSDVLTPAAIGAAPAASPTFTGNATFDASSGVPLTITNTGTGNSFVVNDESSDASPFVISNNGNIGIGDSATTTSRLLLGGTVTGTGTNFVVLASPTAQSAVTTLYSSLSFPGVAADCALTNLFHYGAQQGTYSGTVATQIGFWAHSGLTSATNNYGFRADIASGTGRWNFFANGTAPNYFAGNVGIGSGRTSPATALDVNGVITVSAGTAAAPALVASGDSNTGAFFPAADTFAISTAGQERVRVDAAGRLRIGAEAAATHLLEVQGQNATTLASQITVSSGVGGVTQQFRNASATDGSYVATQFWVRNGNGSNQLAAFGCVSNPQGTTAWSPDFVWTTRSGGAVSTERMRLRHDGNLGLATGDPTAALDINSDKIRLRTAKTPASASDTGNAGDICWDASYLYICTATNTWRRIAHSTW